MKKKAPLLFLLFIFSLSCKKNNEKTNNKELNFIKIGIYTFQFPLKFQLKKENSIDSYSGIISNDSLQINFDYGYYSNKLIEDSSEYLNKGTWKENIENLFLEEGITYDQNNKPSIKFIDIKPAIDKDSSIGNNCDYVVKYNYKNKNYTYPLYIPLEIKEHLFQIDTIDNNYRKIIYSKKENQGITGMYISDMNSFNKTVNSYMSLSIYAKNLSKSQQDSLLKIFKSIKINN